MEQETLIYIDDKDKYDASAVANQFTQNDLKNRAYINTLGAELALKYLASENIEVSNLKNIHSIRKVLEELDISDIMLPNIHIDVRVIFDENAIFIPKSHFEYNLLPDIYLVLKLGEDFSHVQFLGFFEPRLINTNNTNNTYYFIEKEKLSPISDLINYIKNHNNKTEIELSDEDYENSERIIISMCDNDVDENEKKYLINQLIKNSELRDRFIEYENFETLSYKAVNDNTIIKKEISEKVMDEFDVFDSMPYENIPEISKSMEEFIPEIIDIEESIDTAQSDNVELTNDEYNIIESQTEDSTTDFENELPESFEPIENFIPEITENEISQEEIISLENVKTNEDTIAESIYEEETISLDEIIVNEPLVETDTVLKETISFDNFASQEIPNIEDSYTEETNSFDNITDNETTEYTVSFEDLPQISDNTTKQFDVTEENITFAEDINEELKSFGQDTTVNSENTILEEDTEDITKENETFGKNLLENLNAESMDAISIEELVDSKEEEISSQELISQIDEILNFSEEQTDTGKTSEGNEDNEIESETSELEIESTETDDLNDYTNSEPIEEEIDQDNNIEEYSEEISGNQEPENIQEQNFENEEISETEDSSYKVQESEELTENNDNFSTTDEVIENIDQLNELEILYNDTDDDSDDVLEELEETQNETKAPTIPGLALFNKPRIDKKTLIVAASLATILIATSIFIIFKPKNNNDNETATTNPELNLPAEQTTENILEANTPAVPKENITETKTNVVKELKNTQPNPTTSESYLTVNRLVWDVPDVLSQSSKFQNYLITAGKSIKLSLSADLLLATEYAYTDQIKLSLKLNNTGAIQDMKILSSSGSTQIDNIVLQSVKDTLNVIKPPADEIRTPDFNLNLIIYF